MMYAVIIPITLLWGFALIQWIRAEAQKRKRQKLKILCNMLYGKMGKNIYKWENGGKRLQCIKKVSERGESNEKNNGKHI